MKLSGKIDGQFNEIENVIVDLVDELPSLDVIGHLIYNVTTDRLYIYTNTGWSQIPLVDYTGPITFASNLTISNILDVHGSTTLDTLTVQSISTFEDVIRVKYNIIDLNYGEPGSGVQQFSTISGLHVDRGALDDAYLVWYEHEKAWTVSDDGGLTFYEVITTKNGDVRYLALDGSNSPINDINFNNFKIINLGDAVNDYDAISFGFANDRYLRLDGSNKPTADIDWNGYSIINLLDPINDQDASTKHYVDVSINSAPFIKIDGSNVPINDINFNGNRIKNLKDPMELQDAATRNYVDEQITNHDQEHDDTFLRLDGLNKPITDIDFDNHKIVNLADPVNNQDAATKNYVDTLYYSGGGDRGVYVPGIDDSGTTLNSMRYINIAVLSDATYFNTLYASGRIHSASTSNGIRDRGVIFGGTDAMGNVLDSIEYMSISTGSAANFFGNLGYKSTNSGGAFSNS